MLQKLLKNGIISMLLFAMLFSASCQNGTEQKQDGSNKPAPAAGTSFSSLGTENNLEICAENEGFMLLFNPQNCNISVKNTVTGFMWTSNLDNTAIENILAEDVKNEYLSQLKITYYDKREKEYTMLSYKDSVAKKQFELFSIPNGVKVVYTIGESDQGVALPLMISESTLKNKVFSKTNKENQEKILNYYNSIKYEELSAEEKNEYSNKYPVIKKENLYVLKKIGKKVEKELSAIFDEAGFTKKNVYEEYDKLGFEYNKATLPCFTIPVEYTLSAGELLVNIPSNEIVYDNTAFKLTSIDVLPYFGASEETDNGYIFLPDGQGSLIDLHTQSEQIISLKPYGKEVSTSDKDNQEGFCNTVLPVFGIKKGNESFISTIQSGSGISTVMCQLKNSIYKNSIVYSKFELLSREVYSSESKVISSELIKYAAQPYKGNISVVYSFLQGENSGYVDMAKKLRQKIFKDSQKIVEKTPFFLEVYGVVTRRERILGYPVNRERALTTYSQAVEIAEKLKTNGVANIVLRYNNWNGDKYLTGISDIGKVPSVLGGKKQFKELLEYTKSNNIKLYLNSNLILQNLQDSFANNITSKKISGETSIYSEKGILGKTDQSGKTDRAVLTTEKAINSAKKLSSFLKKVNLEHLSLESIGEIVFSNFKTNQFQLRDDTISEYRKIFEALGINSFMFDVGNSYTFPFADYIVNLPMSDSRLLAESQSVPFLQIVLHGYISYAGEAINLSGDFDFALLKAVETGSGLRFVLNYAQPSMLKNTNYTYLFSTNYTHYTEKAAKQYKKAAEVLDRINNSTIEQYSTQGNITATTYENGSVVLVNYGENDSQYNNVSVPAKDFIILYAER